jgi:hypothetical protein
MARLLAAAFALLLSAVPSQLFGEGEATRITIQSLYLKAPIEIVDPVILSTFNVWTGPGTWSSDPAFNENAPGFIIDWSSGTVPEVPDRLSSHKVSFYRKLPIERLVNLWRDPSTKDDGAASELLKPFDARLMRCSPVSTRINHAADDDEECARPVEPVETQNTLT